MADEPTIGLLEAIHSTRAIRRFKPDPIPEDVLWAILDAAIRGPTGANRQNWGWVLVQDAEAKRQIAVWFKQEYDNTYGRVDESTLTDTGRIQSGTYTINEEIDYGLTAQNYRAVRHLAHNLQDAPVIVFPCLFGGPGSRRAGRNPRRAGASIFGGVQNMMLAARAYGIGSVITGWAVDMPELHELLNLPEGYEPMALVPMGYPTVPFSQPQRIPVDQVTHWDRWGEQHARPSEATS